MFELIDFIIVRPIINILFIIYNFIGDFGLAIILFTIIIKIITWPLTKKQLHQANIIKKLKPELAKIKKNCKGNRQLEMLQMTDLYKRHNIKTFRSIFNLFIQIPIIIALFTAIRTMVLPTKTDNIELRAYPGISQMENIQTIIDIQKKYLQDHKNSYDFHPRLFNAINLDQRPGFSNLSAFVAFIFAILASITQYFTIKQNSPSKDTLKKRSFKEIVENSKEGKEVDNSEINDIVSEQMAKTMPIMILLISFSLPGALVFYYFFNGLITLFQQRIILDKASYDMDNVADKEIIKELSDIKEAKIVEKKQNITRISAKIDSRKNKLFGGKRSKK